MEELDPAYFFDTDKGYLVPYLEPLSYDLETETEGWQSEKTWYNTVIDFNELALYYNKANKEHDDVQTDPAHAGGRKRHL